MAKTGKKRTTKSDVIKYLNNYKNKLKGDYWHTNKQLYKNCIEALKEGD